MKALINFLAVISFMLFIAPSIQAQDFTQSAPERIADFLSKEKASGKINDEMIVAYLDTLGFKKVDDESNKEQQTFAKQVNKGQTNEAVFIKITLGLRVSSSGIKTRFLRITADDQPLIRWVVNKLIGFGLLQIEGNGDYADLKGKGLTAGTSPNSIMLGYQIEESK